MEDKLVSYEVARLAKEKGFDEKCSFSYKEVNPVEVYQHQDKKYNNSYKKEWVNTTRKNSDMVNAIVSRYSAPTQSLLQKWLRDKHEIHVFIIPCVPYSFSKYKDLGVIWIYDIYKPLLVEYECSDKREFVSYEDALDACLYECLGLINKN